VDLPLEDIAKPNEYRFAEMREVRVEARWDRREVDQEINRRFLNEKVPTLVNLE
jgi:hypothetical protein